MLQLKFDGIIGQSFEIQKVFKVIERVASSDTTILITGETGTGKGLAARAIHLNSKRVDRPFVSINCGAIPENLLESELFGHVRGAFTGAVTNKTGKFERGNSGTIFLDEIGDMSANLQVKILRVLEEGEFEQVGGNKTTRADVRVIAATHRNLERQVEKGLFREDLFYRLYVIPLNLPPLRNRQRDVPLLARYFLKTFNKKNDYNIEGFSENVLKQLSEYAWPGNVRELKNLIERLVVLKQEGTIKRHDLPEKIVRSIKAQPGGETIEIAGEGICLNTAVTDFEKALIIQSLQKAKGVKNKAAQLLHLKRTTLVEKIKRHHLSLPDPKVLKQVRNNRAP
ncbi:MAG: sigma-54-dependent Fis family transcriptional regulator [Deltaproteobacteria bacterium]|jgi:sigma-54 dependent transcriptional regulator, flagellar regulatory protein|nr:sigma-54-dependent Fis family transcriptional regulator [Deltaproteobacteria bacterium]